MQSFIERFRELRILIVGDVMLDEYIWGDVSRISPEAPVPVVDIHHRSWAPGGAANAAANVVSLGGAALLCGVRGADYHGEKLVGLLDECNVDRRGIIESPHRPTTTKTRVMARGQQMVRVDSETRTSLDAAIEKRLLETIQSSLEGCHACILSDYNKGVLSEAVSQAVIAAARSRGKPVVVDPKGVGYEKYRNASVIKPNTKEAEEAIGRPIESEDDLMQASRSILDMVGDCALLLTRGAEGMTLFERGQAERHIPALARTVYDVTGAGDTVVGALAMSLAAGAGLLDAAHFANRAAGVAVGKVGAATVTLDELNL